MPTFLYIEDDLFSREVMKLLLVDVLGFKQVTIFEDSTDFEQKLVKLSPIPEIIFVDIHMEPINGFQILEIIRRYEQFSSSQVIALTASVMNEEVRLLKEAGFNGAVAKPVDSDTFPDTLRHIMNYEEVWKIIV
ncbi:MAG: response regulator [Chloroflexi bacterium]|nr:response regulator [Chloroflexota bacterium]